MKSILNLEKPLKVYAPDERIVYHLSGDFPLNDCQLSVRKRGLYFEEKKPEIAIKPDGSGGSLQLCQTGQYDISLLWNDTVIDRKSVAIVPEKSEVVNDRLGVLVCCQRYTPEMFESCIALLARIGIATAREEFNWDIIEPQRDEFRFEMYDRAVEVYQKYHFDVLGLLAYSSGYAASKRPEATYNTAVPPEKTEDYIRFIRTIVGRYYDKGIHRYEIWNEPDFHSPGDPINFFCGTTEEYAKLLKEAYLAIKADYPQADVHNGGLAAVAEDRHFMQDCIKINGGPYFDSLNIHGYADHAVLQQYQQIREQSKPGAPIWYGESGGHCAKDVRSEADQAALLVWRVAEAIQDGVDKYIYYDMCNDGYDRWEGEYNFGLLTKDGYPKPVFTALRMLARELAGAVPEVSFYFKKRYECRAFYKEAEDCYLYVTKAMQYEMDLVRIRSAEIIDPLDNSQIADSDGQLLWLMDRPVIFKVKRTADAIADFCGILSLNPNDPGMIERIEPIGKDEK